MSYETIKYSAGDGIARVTLNRPDKHNALNHQVIDELTAVFDAIDADDSVSVVVLSGEGKSFCSGFDLKGSYYMTPPDDEWTLSSSHRALKYMESLYLKIWNCPKVTIAQLHGNVLAAGCYLQLLCDISVAGEAARLGHPVRVPDIGISSMPLWQTVLPLKKARYLLMTKRVIDGVQAERFGLVSLVVPDAELVETVEEVAKDCVTSAPAARYTKEVLNTALDIGGLGAQFRYHRQMNGFGRVLK